MAPVVCILRMITPLLRLPACFNEKLRFPEKYTFGLAVLLGNAAEEKASHQSDLGKIICVD